MKSTAPTQTQPNPAAAFLEAGAAIQSLDLQLAELQAQLDELPARETAVADDRTKTPAAARTELQALRDEKTDLTLALKRLEKDCNDVITKAKTLYLEVYGLLARRLQQLFETERSRAIQAITPFFYHECAASPEHFADELPTVVRAGHRRAGTEGYLKRETWPETLAATCATIKEFQLHETPAPTSAS